MKQRNRNHRCMLIWASGATWSKSMSKFNGRRKLRFIKKNPGLAYQLFGNYLITKLTRSKATHLLISDGAVVVDYTFKDMRFWAYEEFINRFPNIIGWSVIETDDKVDFSPLEGMKSSSLFSATFWRLLMWATRGLVQRRNCVTTARSVLKQAGVRFPRRAWSPKIALNYFMENGNDFTAGPPPSFCGGTD